MKKGGVGWNSARKIKGSVQDGNKTSNFNKPRTTLSQEGTTVSRSIKVRWLKSVNV